MTEKTGSWDGSDDPDNREETSTTLGGQADKGLVVSASPSVRTLPPAPAKETTAACASFCKRVQLEMQRGQLGFLRWTLW